MPKTICFHLDENVSYAIANGLKRRGIDVTTTPEAGLIGASDEEQFAFLNRTKASDVYPRHRFFKNSWNGNQP